MHGSPMDTGTRSKVEAERAKAAGLPPQDRRSVLAALDNVVSGPRRNGLCGCLDPAGCCPCAMRAMLPLTARGVSAWMAAQVARRFLPRKQAEPAAARGPGEIRAMVAELRTKRYDRCRKTADHVAQALQQVSGSSTRA